MNSKQILADFQFVGNKVSKFEIETKDIKSNGNKSNITFEFDYDILDIKEDEDRYIGFIQFNVLVKAKVKNAILFKITLNMEGAFVGNANKLKSDDFREMLELNGLTTLSQLSRAYILSVTALSGINPPIKLPMINIISLVKQKKYKESNV